MKLILQRFRAQQNFLILLILGWVLFVPIKLTMPAADLDSAWAFVMNYVVSQHWVMGQDIVFSYGFFPYLVTFLYSPMLFPYLMCLWFLFVTTFLVYLYDLMASQPIQALKIILPLLLLVCAMPYLNVLYPTYALLYFLYALNKKELNVWLLLGSVLMAVSSLIKFNASGFIVLLMLILTGVDLKNKVVPVKLLVYVLSIIFIFWMNHQPFSALPSLITGIGQYTSGYNSALGLGGTRTFPVVVYILWAIFLCKFFYKMNFYQNIRLTQLSYWVLALSLFIIFKSSFIRADHHIFLGFAYELNLNLLFLIMYFSKSHDLKENFVKKRLLVLVLMSCIFAIACKIPLPNVLANFRNIFSYSQLSEVYMQTLTDIKNAYPLPPVKGSVDIYSYEQTVLLANDLHYDPRPMFQSLTAFTPKFLTMNRDHLLSAKAPNNIFFAIQPIDNRYPSLEDGLSWPVLLGYYQAHAMVGHHLWLIRNVKPRVLIVDPVVTASYRVGEDIALPATLQHQLVWMQVEFPQSIASRVVAMLFKPVQIYLTITLNNNQKVQYRLIDGMATAGFLLAPFVGNTQDFAALYTASGRAVLLQNNNIKAFVISFHGWQAWFTPRTYQVRLGVLNFKE